MMMLLSCVLATGCVSTKTFDTSCYDGVLAEEFLKARDGQLFYQYGFVNNDDIPELFVVRGSVATDTVSIYTYDKNAKQSIYVGDFGSSGYCYYTSRNNQIISVYGNMGIFYVVNSGIDENGSSYLEDIILRNNSFKTESFYGFPTDDGFTGAMQPDDGSSDNIKRPDDSYKIDESKADEIESKLLGGNNAIRVSLESMNIYTGQ